jgi:predicted esterase
MKKLLILLFLGAFIHLSSAQNFIDTTFTIATDANVNYGSAVNFAGQSINLQMDISYPTNDTAPSCGRPLVIIVHGGAWLAGSKNESFIPGLRQDFAKRGYVAVAINYRLGMFQTSSAINCNIPNWNCMNMADSAEWTRALYRGIQDTRGAIRHMILNQAEYNIDPSNVYVVGESAGAFIAMGVGFMDDASEKPAACGALPAVSAPHQNYYAPCIQNTQFDIPIGQMNLSRPDLGPIDGTMNPTNLPYFIRGVGAFYGGIYEDLFSTNNSVYTPILYMFHQPNDLIVPIGFNRLLNGFNACAMATNCVNIQNRRWVYGSSAINNMVDTLSIPLENKPQILYQSTNNNSDCLGQIANPATGGHQLDSYWTRSSALAAFFAPNIGTNDCLGLGTIEHEFMQNMMIFPNPNNGSFAIQLNSTVSGAVQLQILDLAGKTHVQQEVFLNGNAFNFEGTLGSGVYLIQVTDRSSNLVYFGRVIVE